MANINREKTQRTLITLGTHKLTIQRTMPDQD
jgi:hypothetical protein